MPGHNLENQLENATMSSTARFFNTPEGRTWGHGKTVGNGVQGWAPGALFVHTDGAANTWYYRNTGSKTAATWTSCNVIPASEVLAFAALGYCSFAGTAYATFADNAYINLGTGSDVQIKWNATYLEAGPASGMWADCPLMGCLPNTASCYEVFDDFFTLDTTATVGDWAAFNVGTGTTTINDDVAGGELAMVCQATTDDACEQLNYVSAPFLLAAGKTLWYEARVKQVGDVQSEVSFGLCALSEDLTAVADVYPQDGISFAHQDASMALALTCSKNGTNTGAVAGVKTMVTGTYATYGLLIDGVTSVTPYINGTAGTAATATINDDESMCPYFLVRNGDATTQQKLYVDYVRVVQLR